MCMRYIYLRFFCSDGGHAFFFSWVLVYLIQKYYMLYVVCGDEIGFLKVYFEKI